MTTKGPFDEDTSLPDGKTTEDNLNLQLDELNLTPDERARYTDLIKDIAMAGLEGKFIINGLSLPLPPNGISFISEGTFFTYASAKKSLTSIVKTGHGDLSLQVSWIVATPNLEMEGNAYQQINSQLLPIYKLVSTYPLTVIENDIACLLAGSIPSLWMWRAMTVSTGGNIPPQCVSVDMVFDYFNYSPFMNNISFKGTVPEGLNFGTKFPTIDPESGLIFPDGKDTYTFSSIAEKFNQVWWGTPTKNINESPYFNAYKNEVLSTLKPLTQPISQQIGFYSDEIIQVTLPPDARPKEEQATTISNILGPINPTLSQTYSQQPTGQTSAINTSFVPIQMSLNRDFNKKQITSLLQDGKNPELVKKLVKLLETSKMIISQALGVSADTAEALITPNGAIRKNASSGSLHQPTSRKGENKPAIDIYFPGLGAWPGGARNGEADRYLNSNPKVLTAYLITVAIAKKLNLCWGGYFSDGWNPQYGDFMHFDGRAYSHGAAPNRQRLAPKIQEYYSLLPENI